MDGLCPGELARARGIRSAARRAEFIATRTALRRILAYHLDETPPAIEFDATSRGKPFLCMPAGTGIEFNVSHGAGMACIALGRDRAIGVDVEKVRPRTALSRLAARFFTMNEQRRLAGVSEAERLRRFYEIWCRKEAVLKALGAGITSPLDKLDVLGAAVTVDGILDMFEKGMGSIQIQTFTPALTHIAALAYTGDLAEVHIHHWNPSLLHHGASGQTHPNPQ